MTTPARPQLTYIVPGADWVIDRVGRVLTRELRRQFGLRARVATRPPAGEGHLIHYGEVWSFLANAGSRAHARNPVVATVYHGDRDGWMPELAAAMERLLASAPAASRIVTASGLMEARLLRWGLPRRQVVRLPLGVDLGRFQPPTDAQRLAQRRRLGVPPGAVCIGSFQKDGQGWREGLQPKWIKGPDVFVDVAEQLAKRYPVFVLLAGPARGYVMQELSRRNIPFRHARVRQDTDLVPYYHCVDLYLITSREEGGPLALLESMATGVPVVSTRVGMAEDVIEHGVTGSLVGVDDLEALVEEASRLIEEPRRRQAYAAAALAAVQAYDWRCIARRYFEEIYLPVSREHRAGHPTPALTAVA